MSQPLLIEIASDVVCPWCYIGKRRLEKALESLKGEVEVKEERVRGYGISGVPTFIFNKTSGLSGAYPPEMLAQAIREAASAISSSTPRSPTSRASSK